MSASHKVAIYSKVRQSAHTIFFSKKKPPKKQKNKKNPTLYPKQELNPSYI